MLIISGVEFHDKHDFDSLRLIQHLNQEILDVFDLIKNLNNSVIFILLSIKMHISYVEFHDKHDFDSLRLIQHLDKEILDVFDLNKNLHIFVNFN